MKRAVIVICDSLRADLIAPDDAPFLTELRARAAGFAAHRSVFPSTTRASAASIATGCYPARHGRALRQVRWKSLMASGQLKAYAIRRKARHRSAPRARFVRSRRLPCSRQNRYVFEGSGA